MNTDQITDTVVIGEKEIEMTISIRLGNAGHLTDVELSILRTCLESGLAAAQETAGSSAEFLNSARKFLGRPLGEKSREPEDTVDITTLE